MEDQPEGEALTGMQAADAMAQVEPVVAAHAPYRPLGHGEHLEGGRELGGWLWCVRAGGEAGWVPLDCLQEIGA